MSCLDSFRAFQAKMPSFTEPVRIDKILVRPALTKPQARLLLRLIQGANIASESFSHREMTQLVRLGDRLRAELLPKRAQRSHARRP